ncbi:DUF2282 domain-containing protein [Arenicella xantha]|uniref:Putative membrane protein n=1 Tax=Arenicella xantha TaxID=644221 RepID=A0A395JFZ1_9GAMM|nr:DUF2282 domain-containing protein [Arenicella xantha]RBP48692.1 putative membrane protein [Arenicella xantha]
MNNNKKTATTAASILAAALMSNASLAHAGKEGYEKCQGVAKTGMNDCGANGHGCAGLAATDGDANEWIYLPKGTCAKIVGGVVKAPKPKEKSDS